MDDLEFRPGPGLRSRQLWSGVITLIIAIALVIVTWRAVAALRWLFVIPLAYAAIRLTSYVWRGRFHTRITAQGLDVQGFLHRFLPWETIKGIEAYNIQRVKDIPVANPNIQGRYSSRDRPRRKRAFVQIVRDNGRIVELPAPLLSDFEHDPQFDAKVKVIRERWQQAIAARP
jgi:hypothetical protein